MSAKLDPQRSVLYRALAHYYVEEYGIPLEQMADTSRMSVNDFEAFYNGTSDDMTLNQREAFCEMTRDFVAAERAAVEEAKWYRRPIPRTAEDVANEVLGVKR